MKITKPHILFFILGFIFLFFGLIHFNSDNYSDINIHDTYLVIAYFHLYTLISIIFSFIGLMYYIHSKFKIPLIKYFTYIHVIGTLVCIALFYINPLFHRKNDFPLLDDSYSNNSLVILIGIIIQIIFIINSFLSTINHLFKKK